ncbi:MAG: AbrB/MazE/SpoVT family DNA-binding domain-containing protein [Terriglobales bacterium]
MKAQLVRWGNSHAVRIPKKLVEAAKLKEGEELELKLGPSGAVEVHKAKKDLTLKDLVEGITPRNRHRATDWGRPVGEEIW